MLTVIPLRARISRDATMASTPTVPEAAEMPDTGSAQVIRTAVTPQDDRGLAARHRAFLVAATSDNTRQAYRSAIKHYLDWGGVLPADEPVVIRYLGGTPTRSIRAPWRCA